MMGFYIACASLVVLALGLDWLQPRTATTAANKAQGATVLAAGHC